MSLSSGVNSGFATTRWSLIVAANQSPSPAAEQALAQLCQSYWYPLYAFVRRRGHQPSDARDLTQGFFLALLEKNYVQAADPNQGRFRSFLVTAITRYLSKQREYKAAQKRGGAAPHVSLDFDDGERRYQQEPVNHWTAEKIFDRRWALTLLERALARLRGEFKASGKLPLFEALKTYLTGAGDAPAHQVAAEQLGLTAGAVKVAIHRLRQKYREALREEVAQTVVATEDVDDEIATLLRTLRGE